MSIVDKAAELGWPTLDDLSTAVDPRAVHLMPAEHPALGLSLSDDGILEVALSHIPTAAELQALEQCTGCQVAPVIVTPEVLAVLTERARRVADVPPEDVLASIPTGGTAVIRSGAPMLLLTEGGGVKASPDRLTAAEIDSLAGFLLASGTRDAEVRFRDRRWAVHYRVSQGTPSLVLRELLDQLPAVGLPAELASWVPRAGLVVVATPAGHGRSTLARQLVAHVCSAAPATRVVVVDARASEPVVARQPVTHRVLGTDVNSVAQAAREATADVSDVVVCDVVDYTADDVAALLAAAAAGALVIVTVPAVSHDLALSRLFSAVPGPAAGALLRVLAGTLLFTVVQRLVLDPSTGRAGADATVWSPDAETHRAFLSGVWHRGGVQ